MHSPATILRNSNVPWLKIPMCDARQARGASTRRTRSTTMHARGLCTDAYMRVVSFVNRKDMNGMQGEDSLTEPQLPFARVPSRLATKS